MKPPASSRHRHHKQRGSAGFGHRLSLWHKDREFVKAPRSGIELDAIKFRSEASEGCVGVRRVVVGERRKVGIHPHRRLDSIVVDTANDQVEA
jgi:hypothetical protein